MFEYVIPVDTQAPIPHSDEAFDETHYGLEGVTFCDAGRPESGRRRGNVLVIARESVDQAENCGIVDARGLSVIALGLPGPEFFRKVADVPNLPDDRMSS